MRYHGPAAAAGATPGRGATVVASALVMGVRSAVSFVGRGAWCAAVVVLALACGSGSEKPPTTASSGNELGAKPDSSTTTGASTSEAPAGPRRPSCDDGSCFVCGESICPNGFYCETAGSAAPACGWAAGCAQKATCACLGPQTKGCTCEERGGVAHVRCGGS